MESVEPRYKISFCIPTFNRAFVLDDCLNSIVSQLGFEDYAEIVVSDNASTDNTSSVVYKYQCRYPGNIVYYRNKENVGMEANFVKVLELGRGKLLKLMNDYSILKPNMLNSLLEVIDQNSDEKTILFFRNKPKGDSNTEVFYDLNPFLRDVTYWTTWIGTFGIWKNDFIRISDLDQYMGLLFVHMLIFFDNFKLKKKVTVCYFKFIENSTKFFSKGGYDFYQVFLINYIGKIMHPMYCNGDINYFTLRKVKGAFVWEFLRFWLPRLGISAGSGLNSGSSKKWDGFKLFIYYPCFYFSVFLVSLVLLKKNLLNRLGLR